MDISQGDCSEDQALLPPAIGHDEVFIRMLCAFRKSGGLAPEGEITRSILSRHGFDWRKERGVQQTISFEWAQQSWLPWFQFNREDMFVRTEVRLVIRELWPVFSGLTLALWFATPNLWIGDRKPVDSIENNLADVLCAARADRMIAAEARAVEVA